MSKADYNSLCKRYDTTYLCRTYRYKSPKTPRDFERYVECRELPEHYPGAEPLSQYPVTTRMGNKVIPDVLVIFNGVTLETVDSKYKLRLSREDLMKLRRDMNATGTPTGTIFTNHDIQISNRMKMLAEKLNIKIIKTKILKYKRNVL